MDEGVNTAESLFSHDTRWIPTFQALSADTKHWIQAASLSASSTPGTPIVTACETIAGLPDIAGLCNFCFCKEKNAMSETASARTEQDCANTLSDTPMAATGARTGKR